MFIKQIVNQFNIEGEFDYCEEFGSGHINDTFLIYCKKNDGTMNRYILQHINNFVFRDVEGLMENIFLVTDHIRNKALRDISRSSLRFLRTKDGKLYYRTPEGKYYRMYIYIPDSYCVLEAQDPDQFRRLGQSFGIFQKQLSDFDASLLKETIPHFHDTPDRFEKFLTAVRQDSFGRAEGCRKEIDFALARREFCSSLTDLLSDGTLPLRVTHNDTKLSNVLFDDTTDEVVCVIDLDTVMPGLAAYDFGDSIRSGASSAAEDESDLDLIHLELDYFKAYSEGFIGECRDSFSAAEIDSLAMGARMMTFECGMRFLTDYLQGDSYFKIRYEDHNLVRCRAQFRLLEDMEAKFDEMLRIVRNI